MESIRLLLADDHPLIREGFRSLLGRNKAFEIVGVAENGRELIDFCYQMNPDVVLADINMPLLNGIEAIKRILTESTDVKFIILTMHEEREYILDAVKAGVHGYILKNTEAAELEKAILTIYRGGKYFSPSIAAILAESMAKPQVPGEAELTTRELEVLKLVADGLSTKQIADRLAISMRTVETHRINMLKKMKVSNSAELIRKCVEMGLI